ncbi:hypothetical protein BJ166DRAFT_519364 [Pestalotiopsis sp. NC0098]|nr:hypothetical protein BJ166DRAFT_519364 [Pestalotiopsis sp. NC0098]
MSKWIGCIKDSTAQRRSLAHLERCYTNYREQQLSSSVNPHAPRARQLTAVKASCRRISYGIILLCFYICLDQGRLLPRVPRYPFCLNSVLRKEAECDDTTTTLHVPPIDIGRVHGNNGWEFRYRNKRNRRRRHVIVAVQVGTHKLDMSLLHGPLPWRFEILLCILSAVM